MPNIVDTLRFDGKRLPTDSFNAHVTFSRRRSLVSSMYWCCIKDSRRPTICYVQFVSLVVIWSVALPSEGSDHCTLQRPRDPVHRGRELTNRSPIGLPAFAGDRHVHSHIVVLVSATSVTSHSVVCQFFVS